LNLAISIDIGGTNTKIGLVNQEGSILSKTQFPTWQEHTEKKYFQLLFSHITKFISNGTADKIIGIGIDAPSCVPEKGIIKGASNLPLKGEVPIVPILSEEFNKPVFLCNDANAAALGEGKFGNAKNMKNYAVVTLGTGLGCGIIVNKQILSGQSGLSGELGHVIARRNGRKCGCGKNGCLETYISATGIRRNFFAQLAETNATTSLNHIPLEEITTKLIAEAALKGDPTAIKAFEFAGTILGESLSDFVHLFEPEAIILAGGVASVGDLLFNPTRKSLQENLLQNYKKNIQLMPSALGENEGALLGASSLVFDYWSAA
jgi:glucokinase